MIKVVEITKKFKDKIAVDNINTEIEKGKIYGLVGSNGSGKSTFLRTVCGVYLPNSGELSLDELPIYENPTAKSKIFFVPDEMHFVTGSTIKEMSKLYCKIYPNWSQEKFDLLTEKFPIDKTKNIKSFSKGMKRQAAIILALSCQPEYLLLDEAFDGLDPIIRVAVRRIIADEVAGGDMGVIISSHNLRELEDFCDSISIMHEGKIILQQAIDTMALEFCKVQLVLSNQKDNPLPTDKRFLSVTQEGTVVKIVAAMSRFEMEQAIKLLDTNFVDFMKISLEEVFIYEMEAIGYDSNKIVF